MSDYEHLTDEQLDLELARSEQAPPSFNPRSVSSPQPPFHVGDDSDLDMSASAALPPLPAGDDSDPCDDDADLPHSWWIDDGGRSLFYPIAKIHIPAVKPESQSSTGSSLAASRLAFVHADMKDTAS